MSKSGRNSALAMAGLLGFAGAMHFVKPEFFEPIVPRWMPGSPRTTVLVSGGVELASAALLANRRTRRWGGIAAFLTFLGVWPANIGAAVDGGMAGLDPPWNSAWVAWLRVPLQIPLLLLAARITRERS